MAADQARLPVHPGHADRLERRAGLRGRGHDRPAVDVHPRQAGHGDELWIGDQTPNRSCALYLRTGGTSDAVSFSPTMQGAAELGDSGKPHRYRVVTHHATATAELFVDDAKQALLTTPLGTVLGAFNINRILYGDPNVDLLGGDSDLLSIRWKKPNLMPLERGSPEPHGQRQRLRLWSPFSAKWVIVLCDAVVGFFFARQSESQVSGLGKPRSCQSFCCRRLNRSCQRGTWPGRYTRDITSVPACRKIARVVSLW